MDGNGRVLLPSSLREFAGLSREAVLVGLMNKFEIWSRERWDEFMRRPDGSFEEISQKLSALGV